mmetsp:Transcript_64912/g.103316  ORF Transcript_64912/g.103316 Transcript_64912/m.103316 type:complete len:126 (-) Transcript_64912:31-408(-)
MQLPPMLRAVHQQQQQQQQLLQQQQEEMRAAQQQSLADMGYDLIDACGEQFRKVAPYVNKTLEWGWFPLVLYYGLKQGTHKYYAADTSNLPEEMQDTPMERNAAWSDCVPFVGSHGSPKTGILPS